MNLISEIPRNHRPRKARSADFYAYDVNRKAITNSTITHPRRATSKLRTYTYAAPKKPFKINLSHHTNASTSPPCNPSNIHATPLRITNLLPAKNLKIHLIHSYAFSEITVTNWPSRDPIGERGGLNLYGFCFNNSYTWYDDLGGMPGKYEPKWKKPKPTPISDLPDDLKNLGQGIAGATSSVLSGDIFGPALGEVDIKEGQCEYLITINGIWNKRANWEESLEFMQESSLGYKNLPGIYVPNPTSYLGDVFAQIPIHELTKAQDITTKRAASAIIQAAEKMKANGCCCWYVHVVGHSQGTMIADRAFARVPSDILKHVTFLGLGGEKYQPDDGRLAWVRNVAHVNDPVPHGANGFLNLTRNFNAWHGGGRPPIVFGDKENDPKLMGAHHFMGIYSNYMEANSLNVPHCPN